MDVSGGVCQTPCPICIHADVHIYQWCLDVQRRTKEQEEGGGGGGGGGEGGGRGEQEQVEVEEKEWHTLRILYLLGSYIHPTKRVI